MLFPVVLGMAALIVSPEYEAELVFPLHSQHNHAPGIVECSNGALIVSWYRGSGERRADDVAIWGARRNNGTAAWTAAFVMADTPGFLDGNTCMMIDGRGKLWLFWPVILANSWESCITHYKFAADSSSVTGPVPEWDADGVILLKPDDFSSKATRLLDEQLKGLHPALLERRSQQLQELRNRLNDRLYQRLGWQPRCKPTVLPFRRILLPLYSDKYSFSIMAMSDDQGATWYASEPLMGFGNIQPAVLRRDGGTLVAWMRENGPRDRIRVAESNDDGLTWGRVGVSDFPNPGLGLDGIRMQNGHWLLVYNDTTEGRSSLAVSISDDEGASWKWTRHLERHASGAYHYPAVIQGRDGTIHVVYSYFVQGGKSMKHAAFNEAWIQVGDSALVD